MSRLFVIVALLLLASAAVGQPVVSGVSGEIVRNGSITISGDGFGVKGVPAPVVYEDFQEFYDEVATAGDSLWVKFRGANNPTDPMGSLQVNPGSFGDNHRWTVYLRNQGQSGVFGEYGGSSASPPSRYDGDTALLSPYGWGAYANLYGSHPLRDSNKGIGVYESTPSTRWYISFWTYRHTAAGTEAAGAGNAKIFGSVYYAPLNKGIRHDIQELFLENPINGGRNIYDCTGHAWGTDFRKSFISNSLRWNEHARFECYIQFETEGKYSASFGGTVFADSVNGERSYNYDDIGCPTPLPDWAIIGHFFSSNGVAGAATDGYLDIYHSEVYIDTTQARVEIGDDDTWSDCVHREILLPTGWSATSITATLNDGLNGETTAGRQFVAGELAYIYVIHRNGDVNAEGYPVTIGGTVAPGAPGQPQNVTATEID